MFLDECTCRYCGRTYRHEYRKGRTARMCNSCRTNRPRLIQRRKERLVELHGGGCEICGYRRCIRALTFHHVEPATKRFNLANGLSRSWESLVHEVGKCVLVCENCHREIHHGLTDIPAAIRLRAERNCEGVDRIPRRRSGRPASS